MTDKSSEQFNELLANLVVMTNNALKKSQGVPPLALGLNGAGDVSKIIGIDDEGESLNEMLNAMQGKLSALAERGEIEASCIAYANVDDRCIVALMENDHNYCSKITIPVVVDDGKLALDLENIDVDDGALYVFPICEGD